MTRTTKKTVVPSLEQYAYSMLPPGQHVPFQVLRSVMTKRTRPTLTKKEQLVQKTKTIFKTITPGSPPKKKEILNFTSLLKTQLKIYLETQPVVPLDILSNLYNLFEHGLLKSSILRSFQQSTKPILILDNYIGGDENVCLLFKYSRKTYLIILKEQYMDFYQSIPEQIYQKYEKRIKQGTAPLEAFVRHMPANIHVKYAVPITTSHTDTLPIPFQQQDTTLRLSRRV